ncbi:MAG: cardiolipin synthase ClsB [Mitsuaria chitosanitabida]|uniref:cardiolipin synthase ClsB n=1 Tax=Roseateles chitosanitabidus TaxID=65048 RepID=UPI001B1B0700|nr:cardiolipin synthase ClsB [Roseateles chitosanitabidus]MBO9685487.1 cardiolipin synthase ClsB [Roseateles chitosanitabidus]
MKRPQWTAGNRIELLENGEYFFPALFSAIESARHEVLIETFILFEDKVGLALHEVLVDAARRGVRVDVTVDGFGSPALSEAFVRGLTEAGVRLHVFDPPPRLSRRLRPFRRLHRKIAVIDGRIGFIGGINFSADHLLDYGPESKQDYAVRVRGPVVAQLRHTARTLLEPGSEPRRWWPHRGATPTTPPSPLAVAGPAKAVVVTRDNHRHRDDIERMYRLALHAAQREVIIANAYFFPGFLLLRSLQRAARRGVAVHLVLQGQPDIPWARWAARMVYGQLMRAGVHIHEYCERPMHGKVALVDDAWATVGSSNLDPLSLSLNLEANLIIEDRGFNRALRDKLQPLMRDSCRRLRVEDTAVRRWWWRFGVGALVFHLLRHFPRWLARLPVQPQRVQPAAETPVVVPAPSTGPAQAWQWHGMRRLGEEALE